MKKANKEYSIVTASLEQTLILGKRLAGALKPGMVITLEGDLGAGKTSFTGGIAKGLGIEEKVLSPTFNIMRCYLKARIPLYHIDAYRLEEGTNKDIGLEEFIEGNGIAVIEWPDLIKEFIPDSRLLVSIRHLEDNGRLFLFRSIGRDYEDLIDVLKGEEA